MTTPKPFVPKKSKPFFLSKEVKQEYILACAPWWGGFYERLVRNVKSTLRKILGKAILTYEELSTVLCEVEATINSCPLTYLNEDDLETPLTPFHLIFGRNIIFKNSSKIDSSAIIPDSKRVKYVSLLIDHFLKRFSASYLGDLRQNNLYRRGSTSCDDQVAVGDIVLMKEDSLPRNRWRMGRVENLVIGRDGYCRGVKLATLSKTGRPTICSRPLQKLVPLVKESRSAKEICARNESASSSNFDLVNTRPKRKAAVEGHEIRRLVEKFA